MRIQLPADVADILNALQEAGYEAYAVGGCVRDSLLGRIPEDWDITTSALPSQVKKIFRHTIDTGIQHGTVTVMEGRAGYEVTTYRVDGDYSDGRHPDSVSFTPSLLEDLKRRDFTINAMAYSDASGVIDAFGGIADLHNRVIRCVGNPLDRFTEDALRILRALRFSAQLGFSLEEGTEKALSVIAPNLVHVSKERIQTELTKLLLSAHPEEMLEICRTGMAPYLTDDMPKVFQQQERLETRLRRASALPPEKPLRWAAFLAPMNPRSILRELKLDNDTIRDVTFLCEGYAQNFSAYAGDSGAYALRQLLSRLGPELTGKLLTLRVTLHPEEEQIITRIRQSMQHILDRGDCIAMSMLAVTGRDLMQAGISPGPAMGTVLKKLFDHVLRCPEDNQKEKLMELAQI